MLKTTGKQTAKDMANSPDENEVKETTEQHQQKKKWKGSAEER